MKYLKNRLIVLMLMLMIPNAWTLADNCYLSDNHHPIQIYLQYSIHYWSY